MNYLEDAAGTIHETHFLLQMKEDSMMTRITNAEYSQSVAEMRQRIAELEIEVCRQYFLFNVLFVVQFDDLSPSPNTCDVFVRRQ